MEVSSNWNRYMEVVKADPNRDSGRTRVSTKKRSSKRRNSSKPDQPNPRKRPNDTQREARLTEVVALDCEMVGIQDGNESMLARVSIVNSKGQTLYDTFVKPTEPVVDYRTNVSGVRPSDLENGQDFQLVQTTVANMIKGRILVGHALKNDMQVLYLSHPRRKTRDTSKYKPFREINQGRTPSLKKLAQEILGVTLQSGEHSSVEDARAAMQLYNMYRKQWESGR
ncbi:RNA exonuclease 4 [Ischnura elegans]|uniref:RNA exonuclease 4 n=1 Tax=Ischnura elegans TaxID=197161 RepID=UPI001ED89B89|nr:RNA exonuclease 4 [Ischnura elegans]